MSNKNLKYFAIVIICLLLSCKSTLPFDIENNIIVEPDIERKVSLFKNKKAIASKNIRKGISYIANDSTKGRNWKSIVFHLSESTIYDLNKGKRIKYKKSIHQSFYITLFELDSLNKITTKKLINENLEVKVNFKKDIAVVNLQKYNLVVPKFGFFIEFATNLRKDFNEIDHSNYPSIRTITTTNYNEFIPMELQLYRRENAFWEIEQFLMKKSLNYDVKIILEKTKYEKK